jgi:hypothetical protein
MDELKSFLADKLAKYEVPNEMEIRAAIASRSADQPALAVLEMCHEPVSSRRRSELEIFHVGIEVTSGEGYELLRLERPLVGCQRLINYREVVT